MDELNSSHVPTHNLSHTHRSTHTTSLSYTRELAHYTSCTNSLVWLLLERLSHAAFLTRPFSRGVRHTTSLARPSCLAYTQDLSFAHALALSCEAEPAPLSVPPFLCALHVTTLVSGVALRLADLAHRSRPMDPTRGPCPCPALLPLPCPLALALPSCPCPWMPLVDPALALSSCPNPLNREPNPGRCPWPWCPMPTGENARREAQRRGRCA